MLRRKVKAGALQLTLHIVIIIGLFLTAFVLLVHLQKRFKLQTSLVKEAIENCDRGINYALNNRLIINDTLLVNLKDEDYKNLKVYKSYWGAFEKIDVVSKIKKHQFKKTALAGANQLKINRPSLYLEETKTPLVLVGETKIEGLVNLPIQGVKPGYISGESYNGTKLIYGSSKVIGSFPKLSNEWLNYINTVHFTGTKTNNNYYLQVETGQSYVNSFHQLTKVVYSNNKIDLSFIELTGNIIVQSQSEIVVDDSSNLKDIIIIAPKIRIKDGVTGNFQAIASKTISVGENVNLTYPSSLILNEKGNSLANSLSNTVPEIFIKVANNSKIAGQVIFLGTQKSNNYNSQVYISENTTIEGEVYCNQNIELLGTVRGTVFTHNFLVNKGGSIYQNHLYNAKISVNDLDEAYVGLLVNDSKKAVAKWLY